VTPYRSNTMKRSRHQRMYSTDWALSSSGIVKKLVVDGHRETVVKKPSRSIW
jgi:hypothetical protein